MEKEKYTAVLTTPEGKQVDLSEYIKGDSLHISIKDFKGKLYSDCTNIFCQVNRLTELNLPNATEVDCSFNQLTELNLPKAIVVRCCNNQLTEIITPNAERVDCYNNQLTKLTLPKAISINCRHNQLTEIITPNAERVDCYNNQLTKLTLPKAIDIDCCRNQLTKLIVPYASQVNFEGDCNQPLKALVEVYRRGEVIWSQKIDGEIYTYMNSRSFTLDEAIRFIRQRYTGREATIRIEKVRLSQSLAE